MKVKICGLTNLDDALRAVEAGASLLGYNFYPPSPRYITASQCEIIQAGVQLRGVQVTTVGVFVNAAPAEIVGILDGCGLDLAQLSGDEPNEALGLLKERAYKALRPASLQAAQEQIQRLPARQSPPAVLVDTHQPGLYGGTGLTSDWGIARSLSAVAPILLAGGLTPQNVASAIRQVHPWGVDTASGVESAPGRKDFRKMQAFIGAACQSIEEEIREAD